MKLSVQKMGVVLSLLFCLLLNPNLSYADIGAIDELTGTVVDENNEPLIGVNVLVKGTSNGTSTDFDGNFALKDVASDAVLLVSYIGYLTQEVSVNGRTSIQIQLEVNSATLDEVVVTALGLSREKKSLGYAVEEIDGGALNEVIQENVLNAISGKAPGVTINSAGGAAGSSVSMIIRGATSLSGDNQPLFVIDGVPVQNKFVGNTSEVGSRNVVDYGNAISDLNSADIQDISILKGAAASALYGSRAGNGVVIITTKTGKKNQKMQVDFSTSAVFDQPVEFLKFHSTFAAGQNPWNQSQIDQLFGGYVEENVAYRMGPQLDIGLEAIQWNSPLDANGNPVATPLVSHPDNVKDFLRTGLTNTNNIAISGGSDKSSFRASFTNLNNEGIVPGSDYYRNSLNLSANYDINSRLSFNTNINVGRSNSNNIASTERGTNPLQWAYYVSPHIDIHSLEDYWTIKDIQQLNVPEHENPYFLAYEVDNAFFRDRIFGNIGLDYQITDDLVASFDFAMDRLGEERETKIPYSYGRNQQGAYGLQKITSSERNASFNLTYSKYIGDFSLSASAGGNMMHQYYANLSSNGTPLVLPGLFNLSNINRDKLETSGGWSQKSINSVYGVANLGYKDYLYIDISARNDWSSTLPAENRSYFYPAFSASALLNNMFDMGRSVDMVKLRGGWAQVGNDTNPYQLEEVLSNLTDWGDITRLGIPSALLSADLKPEIITSIEFGADVILFQDKIRFSGTYYTSDNENQILGLTLPQSSGYGSKKINAGLVSSRGIELSIGSTLIANDEFSWDVDFNYSFNRTRIEELAEGIDYHTFWDDAKVYATTWVGEDIGNIYDRKLLTVEDESSEYYGWPILDNNGSWNNSNEVTDRELVGNFNPDFIIGGQTSIRYKNFRLSASFDWRQGGEFLSQTYRYGESDWASQRQLDEIINPNNIDGDITSYLKANADDIIVNQLSRVGGPTSDMGGYTFSYAPLGGLELNSGVFNPGVIPEYDSQGNLVGYFENLGGEGTRFLPIADNYPWDFGRASVFDASFIKLREISLTYQFPNDWIQGAKINNLALSVYSRNIILWTKADIGIDPERAFQPTSGGWKQGIERYNVTPFVLPIGIKLSANF